MIISKKIENSKISLMDVLFITKKGLPRSV